MKAGSDSAARPHAIRSQKPDQEALKIAKNTGSFAGVMRTNLTKMLDHIGMTPGEVYRNTPPLELAA